MTPSFPAARPVLLGVLLAAVLLAGAALLPGGPPPQGRSEPGADRTGPLAVLRAWDRDRAAAWGEGDLRALRRLYVKGSRAGAADRAMLASYLDRGLRVSGLRMQVAAAQVDRADADRIALVVTDRVVATRVHGPDGLLALPVDRWSSRRVVLVRTPERWQVASVTTQRRPVASTASTSASEGS